jgi:hypothetical protein
MSILLTAIIGALVYLGGSCEPYQEPTFDVELIQEFRAESDVVNQR